jgi:23S rRNA (pseudouridine1915-N3)-methyltransferase
VKLWVKTISARTREGALDAAAAFYAERLGKYASLEQTVYRSEALLLASLEKQKSRAAPFLAVLDRGGRAYSSEQWAECIRRERDSGRQDLIFAVGPADGWSHAARGRADLALSLGPITLPHELARVVLLEQLYRAFTILAGHPYHCGH